MYAKHKNLPATATFTAYYVGNAEYATLIGRIYALQVGGDRMAFVLESHDWDADTDAYLSGEGDGYDPITVGTYQDPTEAEAELERRARAATAPEPLPGEQPDTHLLADLLDEIVGDCLAHVGKGTDVTLVALIRGETTAHAGDLYAKLRVALSADKGHAVVTRDLGVLIKVRITRSQVRALAAARAKR